MPEVSEMAETEAGRYFDFVVVGAGMIGSSAAKYLSEKSRERNTNIKVAVIGVDSAGWRGEQVETQRLDKNVSR